MKYLIRISILAIFLLAACSYRSSSTLKPPAPQATAKQGLPLASTPRLFNPTPSPQMPAQPPYGVAGKDSMGDPTIPELGNTGYDIQAYNLKLNLDPAQSIFDASMVITSTVTLDHLGRISLDAIGLKILNVLTDNKTVNFYQMDHKAYIDLPRTYNRGENLIIQVDYQGKFQAYTSRYAPSFPLGISKPAPDELLALAEPDGARAWFPCNDHPLDKATFRLQATVPSGLMAISNGVLLDKTQSGGKSTFVWYEDEPLATYLVALVVGKYTEIDQPPFEGIQIHHFILEDTPLTRQHLARTQEILKFLTDLIGPYPYKEFGYVEITPKDAAMETQGTILVARNFWKKKDPSEILVHEAAHQWYGDSVSLKNWGETWLNEGFATYIQYLWLVQQGEPQRKLFGDAEADLLNAENVENSSLVQPKDQYLFAANPYSKGAWVLHMLRQELGDQAFFTLLKDYYRKFAGGYTTTADFQAMAEKVSSHSLATFFDQWTETPVLPHLAITWTSTSGSDTNEVNIQVCQTQSGDPFVIPLDLRFNLNKGKPQQEKVEIDQRQERYSFKLPSAPGKLIPDPDQNLLAGIQVDQVKKLVPCK